MDKRAFTEHGFRKFADKELEGLLRAAGCAGIVVEREDPRVFSVARRP